MKIIESLPLFMTLNTVALSYRTPVFAGMSVDNCNAQGQDKRDALYEGYV